MQDFDSSDITIPGSSDLQLLSLSSVPPGDSSSNGFGGDDLSLSELSLADRDLVSEKPFSLLAGPSTPTRLEYGLNPASSSAGNEGTSIENEDLENAQKSASKRREERLQSDIFILKKLNASFAHFNEALEDAGSSNQRLAVQLDQTDALLNKYVSILSKSETFARLIFDEQWEGADADEQVLEDERIAAEEKALQEEEEKMLLLRRERERAEQERREQQEKMRVDRENNERESNLARPVRGVRGVRASNRGTRGSTATRRGTAGIVQPSGIRQSSSSASRISSSAVSRGTIRRT